MAVVTETITPPVGVTTLITVKARLAGTDGGEVEGYVNGTLVGETTTEVDEVTGVWSLDLTANSLITPPGTVWRIDLRGYRMPDEARHLLVPDAVGPHDVEDLLTDPPGAIIPSALLAHTLTRGLGGHLPDTALNGQVPTWDTALGQWEAADVVGGGGGGGASTAYVDAAVAAEAVLARNATNLTSGTVAEARIDSLIARDSEVTAAVAAEAVLARNATNLTSGTVAEARIDSLIARDSEVTAAIAALRVLQNGAGTVANSSVPNFLSVDIADVVPTKAVTLALGRTLTAARAAATTALPTCTYSNGPASDGVNATLTGDVNGALPSTTTDHVTLIAGDRIVVPRQVAALQNGVYTVTSPGTAGTPFVLTRVPEADTAAKYLNGITVLIADGETYRGSTWHVGGAIVMGTTNISWRCTDTPMAEAGSNAFGGSRLRRFYVEDFETLDATITVSSTMVPGRPVLFFSTGTGAQLTQQHGDASDTTAVGIGALETGLTAAGAAGINLGRGVSTPSAALPMRMGGRFRTANIPSAAEDYNVWLGALAYFIGVNPTSCIAIKVPANSTGLVNYQAVTRNSGVETSTDTGVLVATTPRVFSWVYDPAALAVRFYLSVGGVMTLVATNTTNIPTGALSPGALIDKTVGITSRDLRIDLLTADVPESRSAMVMM